MDLLNTILLLVVLLILLLRRCCGGETNQQPALDLRVTGAWAEGKRMDPIERPPLNLIDTQGTKLSINLKDAGGEPLPDEGFAWSVTPDDGSVATLATERTLSDGSVEQAGPGSRFLLNTHPGSCVVKVEHAASGRIETMPVNITFSAPGELGLSAGDPFEEPPTP